jgi:hypothetical protein
LLRLCGMKNALSILLLASGLAAAAQSKKIINLPDYNKQKIHFGFSLMMNRSMLVPDQGTSISGYRFIPASGQGFGIGITSEYAFHEHFTLRFLPDLSFLQRSLDHQQVGSGNAPVVRQRVESTIIGLPLNLRIRTSRFDNFGLFMLGGGRYSIDIAEPTVDAPVSLKRYDVAYEAGLGIDLFMVYFKCSAELKFIKGLTDKTIYNGGPSNSVNSIKSQCLVLSLTFEG